MPPLTSDVGIHPEAEQTIQNSPIKLTLRLLKTRIKDGESIWYQIELENIGSSPLPLIDNPFDHPELINAANSSGIRLALTDAKGESPLRKKVGDASPFASTPGRALTDAQLEQVERWRKEGLSMEEIARRVDGNLDKTPSTAVQSPSVEWLAPHSAKKTVPWVRWGVWDQYQHKPRPRPVGSFAEFDSYSLMPGIYTLRAEYNYAVSPKLLGELHDTIKPWEIKVQTPAIQVEVVK